MLGTGMLEGVYIGFRPSTCIGCYDGIQLRTRSSRLQVTVHADMRITLPSRSPAAKARERDNTAQSCSISVVIRRQSSQDADVQEVPCLRHAHKAVTLSHWSCAGDLWKQHDRRPKRAHTCKEHT